MTNFSAKILNNAVGALSAQQAVIATTANNIANVNTPGYARRTIDLQTRLSRGSGSGQIDVGNGVQIGQVNRVVDNFIERQLRDAKGDSGSASIQNEFMSRLEQLFPLDGSANTIGSTLTDFYTAVNDLAANPSSIELRRNFISSANNLTDTIRNTYDTIANMQTEADSRIGVEIQNVNSITTQIAQLNGVISSREAGGQSVAGSERDQRDQLLQQLSAKANVNVLEQGDGSVSISLANGFSLVNGTHSSALEVTSQPSFAAGAVPPSLSGGQLSSIVFDYDSSAADAHVDLTQQFTGGTIGGLMALRGYSDPSNPANTSAFDASGTLVSVASRVEALARDLLTTVNQDYRGPDRLPATVGFQPSSGDLNGTSPGAFGLFNATGLSDGGDGIATSGDLTASGIDSFAHLLGVAVTNPRAVAAARDTSGGAATPIYPSGDGANMRALAATQTRNNNFSLGSYSFTGTYDGAYNETLTKVGNEKARTDLAQKVADGSLEAVQSRRDEISGVSLDEEFTHLITFQKAYQAAAKMVKIGDDLLTTIIQLI